MQNEIPVESRKEVMTYLEPFMEGEMATYLRPVEELWQPSDFLPDASKETFFADIKELNKMLKNCLMMYWQY